MCLSYVRYGILYRSKTLSVFEHLIDLYISVFQAYLEHWNYSGKDARYWLLLLIYVRPHGIETKPITNYKNPLFSNRHAEMEQEGKAIDLSLIAKDKNKIRATLSNFPSKVTVLHKKVQ